MNGYLVESVYSMCCYLKCLDIVKVCCKYNLFGVG